MDDEQQTPFTTQFGPAPTIRPGQPDPLPPQSTPQFGPRPRIREGVPEPAPPQFAARFAAAGRFKSQLAERAISPAVVFNQWRGVFSNANPHVIGNQFLAVQENINSSITGQLQVRGGMRAVRFDS